MTGTGCFAGGYFGDKQAKRKIKSATTKISPLITEVLGSVDLHPAISIKAFFLAAYQPCFLIFVSLFRRSVSDPFPCLSCRLCLPLCLSSFLFSKASFSVSVVSDVAIVHSSLSIATLHTFQKQSITAFITIFPIDPVRATGLPALVSTIPVGWRA